MEKLLFFWRTIGRKKLTDGKENTSCEAFHKVHTLERAQGAKLYFSSLGFCMAKYQLVRRDKGGEKVEIENFFFIPIWNFRKVCQSFVR